MERGTMSTEDDSTLKKMDELRTQITSLPNFVMFLARFSSIDLALEALKRVSFFEFDGVGIILPDRIRYGLFKMKDGAIVIIGGTLSGKERVEIFELFQKFGHVEGVALPREAE